MRVIVLRQRAAIASGDSPVRGSIAVPNSRSTSIRSAASIRV